MKFLIIILLINFAVAPMAFAYPQDQLNECILSARKNPAIQDVSETSIKSFCDCSLKSILDEGEPAKNAANKCAKEAF